MNLALGGLGLFGLKTLGAYAIWRAVEAFISRWLAGDGKRKILGWIEGVLNWFAEFLPARFHPQLKEFVHQAVAEVEKNWPDDRKIREVLRLLKAGNYAAISEELKGQGWDYVKSKVPGPVLEMIDALRKDEAIIAIKAKLEAVGAGKLEAKEITGEIDAAVDHLAGKDWKAKAQAAFASIGAGETKYMNDE